MTGKLNVELIKAKMQSNGLTQSALAETLSVTKQAVSRWVTHKDIPRPNKLLQLSKALGLSFNELVEKNAASEPVVAFRKKQGTKTTSEHVDHAKEMGRYLAQLVPYIRFDSLEVPPVLKEPKLDYMYLEKVTKLVRKDIGVGSTETVEFEHLIQRFSDLQAVLVPALWGKKQTHENAVHIYLPESEVTWIYLNLDTNIHDFKFWMAHELGHCLSPSLTGKIEGEDFADAFAGSLLFPKELAEAAYEELFQEKTASRKFASLTRFANDQMISPYSVFMQANRYAEAHELPNIASWKSLHPSIGKFNKSFKDVSQNLFNDLHEIEPADFISTLERVFDTQFFSILSKYLKDSGGGSGFVETVMEMPLLDAKEIYKTLA